MKGGFLGLGRGDSLSPQPLDCKQLTRSKSICQGTFSTADERQPKTLLGKSNCDSSSSGYLTFSALSLPRLFLPLQQMAAVRAPCPWRCFPQSGSASGLKKRQDKKKKKESEGRSQRRATTASAEKGCSRAAATCRDEAKRAEEKYKWEPRGQQELEPIRGLPWVPPEPGHPWNLGEARMVLAGRSCLFLNPDKCTRPKQGPPGPHLTKSLQLDQKGMMEEREITAGPVAVEGLGAEGETLLERPKGNIQFELLSKLGGSF